MTLHKDKSSLLDSLKIERKPVQHKPASPLVYGGAAAALLAIVAAGWLLWPDSRVPVQAVTVEGGAGASGGVNLDASGYVVARRKATLSAKILGKVVELNVEEGQHVKAGDIVARLDDSNYAAALRQAQALSIQAKAAFDNAAPIYARYRDLSQKNAISTDDVENKRSLYDAARTQYAVTQAAVALAQSNQNDTLIRAPFTGVVTDKVAQVGEVVAPAAAGGGSTRTGIATIVDMDSLEVQVDVAENYIERVQIGGDATIHLNAYPEWDIPGSVIAIIPTADQSKGTVKVRVAIKSKDRRILPQMAARVSFMTAPDTAATAQVSPRFTVPANAVQTSGRTGVVYVIGSEERIEKRDVALGAQTQQGVTILSGLSAGERLAAGDLSKLKDGERVRIEPAR